MAVSYSISSAALNRLTALVSSQSQPWEGLARASIISDNDLKLVQVVHPEHQGLQEKADEAHQKDPGAYAALYCRLLKLSKVDTLKTVLVYVASFLEPAGNTDASVTRERATLLLSTSDSPYATLPPLLSSPDTYVSLSSTRLLSLLIASAPSIPLPTSLPRTLLTHLAKLARQALPGAAGPVSTLDSATGGGLGLDNVNADVGVQSLRVSLTRREVRGVAWEMELEEGLKKEDRAIATLVALLRAGDPSPDMQYYLGFSFWLLTFEPAIAEGLNSKHKLIPALLTVAREASKSKVVRVVLAAFRNLVTLAPGANLPPLLVSQALPYLKTVSSDPKIADDEVKEDVDFLRGKLEESFRGLSTYDEYVNELKSGILTWSPGHESEEFWRENAEKLNEKDYAQLKTLLEILKTSPDPQVLAIAANDVAQYVKYSEVGKKKATDLGAKTRVMELMNHEDSQVKYRALVATQVLISQKWN